MFAIFCKHGFRGPSQPSRPEKGSLRGLENTNRYLFGFGEASQPSRFCEPPHKPRAQILPRFGVSGPKRARNEEELARQPCRRACEPPTCPGRGFFVSAVLARSRPKRGRCVSRGFPTIPSRKRMKKVPFLGLRGLCFAWFPNESYHERERERERKREGEPSACGSFVTPKPGRKKERERDRARERERLHPPKLNHPTLATNSPDKTS